MRRFAKGDRKALFSPPQRRNPLCNIRGYDFILFSLKTIAIPRVEVSRLRAASAASIVAAVGRSFRLTRSAFSLSPLATKASLPKGLSDHCRSAFDFRLRRTRHWRAVALWKPSGLSLCFHVFIAEQYKNLKKNLTNQQQRCPRKGIAAVSCHIIRRYYASGCFLR